MRPASRPLPTARLGAGALAIAVIALGGALLAGCTGGAHPSTSPSASRSASASASPSASASTPAASATASPVSIPCTTLVSNQTVYDFNPIYSPKKPVTPTDGSAAARVLKDGGTVCEWVNTSSGATIDLSVGKYTASALAAIRTSAFTGGSTESRWGGDAGYFSTSGSAGTATVLLGSYWITLHGQEFLSPSDADSFMNSAVAAVRSAG